MSIKGASNNHYYNIVVVANPFYKSNIVDMRLSFYSFYTYDATGSYMTTINFDGGSTTFGYNEEGDISTVQYHNGDRRSFVYNGNHLLSESSSFSPSGDLIIRMILNHDWNGKVNMTVQPSNISAELGYDTKGEAVLVRQQDSLPLIIVKSQEYDRQRIVYGDEV